MTATAGAVQVVLQAVVFVHAGLVIARMATGTGGRITGRRPVDRIRVGIVTVTAVEITSVIEWLVCQAAVTETRRCPAVRRVTLPTIDGRGEVPRILSRRIGAVVTGCTRAEDLVVVHSSYR